VYPPLCARCIAELDRQEREAIVTRAITAAILIPLSLAFVAAVSALLAGIDHPIPLGFPDPIEFAIQRHGVPAMPLFAYTFAMVPYGYSVARALLRPAIQRGTPWSGMIRPLVFGSFLLAPFLGPIGVMRDIQRVKAMRAEAAAKAHSASLQRVALKPVRPALPPSDRLGPSDPPPALQGPGTDVKRP